MHNIILALLICVDIIFVVVLLAHLLTETENANRILKEGKAAKGTVLSKKEIYNSSVECTFWEYIIKVQPIDEADYSTSYTDSFSIFPKNLVIRYLPKTSGKIEPEFLVLKEEGHYVDDSKLLNYINDMNTNFYLNSEGVSAKAIIQKFTDLKIKVDKGNKIFAELDVSVFPKYHEPFDSIVKVVVKPSESSIYKVGKYVGIKYIHNDKSVALDFDYRKKKSKLKLIIIFLVLTILSFAFIVYKDVYSWNVF